MELIKFRGPDYTGIESISTPSGGSVVLGHVRLSIIDLDERSNQPFKYNHDISIVFNGEIYNYKELKMRYLCDIQFRTESDTEVLCALYEKYGLESVNYLNGMFAYVIYDRRRNVLVGARDRLGKKPFYYWHSSRGFEFASQPKVIQFNNKFHIDTLARKFYLMHGVIPDPYSAFKEVKKLRAGQCFTYFIDDNRLDIRQYWDLHSNSSGFSVPKRYEEAKETIRQLMFDAVRLRLNANVPVGTFLSGGIDSSLVCAIVAHFNKSLCAYTAHFDNKKFDESLYAIETANYLDVPIKVCDCTGEELLKVFDDYTYYFDEPLADDSLIPSSMVAQKAREDVSVILGGDGGDEIFYGYPKYEWVQTRLVQYKYPYWIRILASPYFYHKGGKEELFQSTQRYYADAYRSLGMFCYSLGGTEQFDRLKIARLQPDGDFLKNKQRGVLAYSDYDIKTFMNGVNMKVDRATMRCSLELRSPIMDYRVVEYSRLLPYEFLYNKDLGLKRILKDILFEMVPRKLLDRPKRGFVPPTSDWFRGQLKEEFASVVTSKNVKELLPEIDVERFSVLRDDFMKGNNDFPRAMFLVYSYVKWLRSVLY